MKVIIKGLKDVKVAEPYLSMVFLPPWHSYFVNLLPSKNPYAAGET
jgi:hypothetical protein